MRKIASYVFLFLLGVVTGYFINYKLSHKPSIKEVVKPLTKFVEVPCVSIVKDTVLIEKLIHHYQLDTVIDYKYKTDTQIIAEDYLLKRVYCDTLFNSQKEGFLSVNMNVQFNRLDTFSYSYNPPMYQSPKYWFIGAGLSMRGYNILLGKKVTSFGYYLSITPYYNFKSSDVCIGVMKFF